MVGSTLSPPCPTLKPTIKFLCSYGGRILPRYPDGKLRYFGGETRVLSVDRSVSFCELLVKLGEMCGTPVNLRCQFPTEDLDALVSITSDEDLANLIEEYERVAAAAAAVPPSSIKIRAFLSGPKPSKQHSSSPPSPASPSSNSNDSVSPKSPPYSFTAGGLPPRYPISATSRFTRHASRPPLHPNMGEKAAGKIPHKYAHHHHNHGNSGHVYFVHYGHHWQ